MDILTTLQTSFFSAWAQVGSGIINLLASIIGASVIFIITLVVSGWVKKAVEELLKAIQFESLSKTSGFDNFLKRAELKLTATEIFGEFVRWFIILVGFMASVNVLGLQPVVGVLISIIGYIPKVFAAALILGAGFIIGRLVDGLVRGALSTVAHDSARQVGKLAYWAVVVLAFFAALDQLKIAPALTASIFQTISWASALAIGLMVGLGAKDLVSKILLEWYEKIKK